MTLGLVSSCDQDEDRILFDVNNQENSVAQLNGGSVLIFNPVEETSNFITVGVSTVSDQARSFTLSVNEDDTTLDSSLYVIPSLTATIPAGSFTGQLEVITPIPASLPPSGLVLVVNLESVEGARLPDGLLSETIGTSVACPSVDLSQVIGSAVTLENPLLSAFGLPITSSDLRTVIAGPEDNQITILGGLSADLGGTDTVLTIDMETGLVTDATDGGISFVNGTNPISTTSIDGRVLTCINQIIINVNNGNFAPPFASLRLTLEVQP